MTDQLTLMFSALGDATRRDMVAQLAEGDATLGELARRYDMSPQAVSKHLKVLEGAGLVSRGRVAQRRPAHLETDALTLMTAWIAQYQQRAEARFGRLDRLLETLDDRPDTPTGTTSSTREENPS